MSRSILFNKIAMLKDEINSVSSRQHIDGYRMMIPKYDTTIEVLSERLKVAEKELEATNDEMYNVS